MKFFKDALNAVFAYEADGSQDHIIPADQSPITQEDALALCNPPIPFEQLAEVEFSEFRSLREMFLNRISGIGFAALAAGDSAMVGVVVDVRQALLDLPESEGVVTAIVARDIAALRAAIKEKCAGIVGSVPDFAKEVFAKAAS